MRESYGWKNHRKGIFMTERAQSHTPGPNKLPARYLQFQKRYPQVSQAYDALGAATAEAGPLSHKNPALGKLALAVGGPMEGAGRNPTRRAVEAGGFPGGIFYRGFLGAATPRVFPIM